MEPARECGRRQAKTAVRGSLIRHFEFVGPIPGQCPFRTAALSSWPQHRHVQEPEALKEIERLKSEGPSADDVAKVKELERRDLETNAKQNSYWIGSMQTVHMYGWDPAGIARRDQRTEGLSQDNIKQMFQKYFPADRYTLVTLKPE